MTSLLVSGIVLLHGLGGRSDLPVAPWLATYAGGAVVAFSFFALAALWSKPRLRGIHAGRPVRRLQGIVDAQATRWLLRLAGLGLLGAFLLVAWLGPDDFGRWNPAPTWFYVWFWVGLVPVSLVCGPVWRLANPLRALGAGLGGLLPGRTAVLPEKVGYWPAVVGLSVFLWIELVYDQAASSRTVATFVTAYAVVHVVAGALFGSRWFDRCEAFEVYANMIARVAPVGRRADGQLVVRNPLDGLAGSSSRPDLTPFVVVVLGSTVFDGVSRTSWWALQIADTNRAEYLTLGTVGLVGGMAIVVGTYEVAIWLTRRLTPAPELDGREFAHSLVPIAIGYTVAHYFSFAIFQGQQGVLLANDPFGRGWDLFGLQGATADYAVLSAPQIAFIQVAAIVLGHVLAVIAAHERAVSLFRPADAVRGQYPLMVVMVTYTCGGIVLLSGA